MGYSDLQSTCFHSILIIFVLLIQVIFAAVKDVEDYAAVLIFSSIFYRKNILNLNNIKWGNGKWGIIV